VEKQMIEKSQFSISQLSYGMTPEELICEGYVDVDYFYDPGEEEWKKELEEIERIVKEDEQSEEECQEF
jgi:hypothetical protein